uniref:transglutaminase family protein n=1 Tax=Vogesella oryzae TaxID=1735285 RepID=UPI0015832FD3
MPVDALRWPALATLLALLLTAAPLLFYLPLWAPLLFALLLAWRAWLHWQQRRLPSRWWLLPLLALPVLALWLTLHTLVGREGGVALLLLLVAGKALESRELRDWRVLLAAGFFLASTPLLFEQGPLAAAWLVFSLFALTWSMVLLAGEDAHVSPRLAAKLLLLSFPVMLVLFVVMPRLPGPLWSMPSEDRRATTGLADSMSPGSVGRMIPSREPAFTAQFFGPQPRPAQLYWRVMVFDQFDGVSWSAGFLPYAGSVRLPADAPMLRYDVVAEPYRGLLPQLEQASVAGEGVRLVSQQRLRRNDSTNNSRLRYRLGSLVSDYYLEALPPRLQQVYQRLPAGNPRTVLAAQRLAAGFPAPEARLLALKQWLQAQGLSYTLNPPQLQGNVVDGFLFGSRQGFCEHFASAFTVLARAAGMPAPIQ